MLLAPIAFAYAFLHPAPLNYRVTAVLDGFLPVFGGNEGKLEAKLLMQVTSKPSVTGTMVTTDLKDASLLFDGTALPLGVEDVKRVFPRMEWEVSASGAVRSKTTAPQVPVRLPGLDPARFLEMTLVPVEFGAEPKDAWSFSRDFSGSPMKSDCSWEAEGRVELAVKQTLNYFEDESLSSVDKSKAVQEVRSELTGKGRATLDAKRGIVRAYTMKSETVSTVTNLASGEKSKRVLKSQMQVELLETPPPKVEPPDWWTRAKQTGTLAREYWNRIGAPQLRAWVQRLVGAVLGG